MAPQISVVVPSYNRREKLLRLLETLSVQKMPPEAFEVIVVLDGSTDESERAVSARTWPFQVNVLRQVNAGPGAARNAGAALARGTLLVFVDDDIQLDPDSLSEHAASHEQHPRAIAVGRVSCQWANHGMGQRGEGYWHKFDELDDGAPLTFRECYSCNFSMEQSTFRNLAGFYAPMRRLEDTELGFRAEKAGIPIVFARNASAIHDVMKTPAGALRDAYHSGAATMLAWRDRPEFLAALGEGFRKPHGELASRAISAAIAAPVPNRLAFWIGDLPATRGTRELHTMLWYRWYLRGSRATAKDGKEFRAFLARRN